MPFNVPERKDRNHRDATWNAARTAGDGRVLLEVVVVVPLVVTEQWHEVGNFAGMGRLRGQQRVIDGAFDLIGVLNLSRELEEVGAQLKPGDRHAAFSHRPARREDMIGRELLEITRLFR